MSDRPPARSGLVVVDKPSSMTSHDVVSRVRRLAGTRKVGHAGTLDPMATGVLLLGVERATRLLGHLALTEKAYDATVRLGAATTTDDAEGEVLSTGTASALDRAAVAEALQQFLGPLEQVPSAVSAIKVDGRRSYARVRAGETVDLPARPVTVHEIGLGALRVDGPFLDVDLSVRCSSGTYIRALARDLGAALAVGGHLTALRRTAVGPVGLAEATPLAELQEGGQQGAPLAMLDLEATVARFFPVLSVDADAARDVGFGRALDLVLPAPGPVALLAPDGRFLALYRHETQDHDGAERRARPVAVFV